MARIDDDKSFRLIQMLAQASNRGREPDAPNPGVSRPRMLEPDLVPPKNDNFVPSPPNHSTPIPPPMGGGGGGGGVGGGGGGMAPAGSPWQQLTPINAMTLAAPHSGPQLEWGNPTLAQLPTVPQFPGVPQHDGTIQGLLGALGTGGIGGGSGGGEGSGGSKQDFAFTSDGVAVRNIGDPGSITSGEFRRRMVDPFGTRGR